MKTWLRLLGSLLVSTVLSLSTLAVLSSPAQLAGAAQTTPTNLALNRPASADSACVAAEGAAKAVDGRTAGNSKWCSRGATKWWRVDLGAVTSVSRVVVKHAGAGGEPVGWNTRDFTLRVSTNDTNWTTVATVTGNTASETTHTFAATQARYVRLNITTPTADGSYPAARIYEVEVYGSAGTPPPTSTPTPNSTPTPAPRPTATPTPSPTPTAAPMPPPANQPALLDHYIQRKNPEYALQRYRPRGFVNGYTVLPDPLSPSTITGCGAYCGWDVLNTPNDGIHRAESEPAWLTVGLTRAATVALVWRGCTDCEPLWLWNDPAWVRSDTVQLSTGTARIWKRNYPAGQFTVGAHHSPPGLGTPRDNYYLLFAESSGQPSGAPKAPAGQTAPERNQPCPTWVHDQHKIAGPDGVQYFTWHAQIDPIYWCYYEHEHGSDPRYFKAGYQPLYDYASARFGASEHHAGGFKSVLIDDAVGHKWYITMHFGTWNPVSAACVRFHEVDVAVADSATGELLADLHYVVDFGASEINTTGQRFQPAGCPEQHLLTGDGKRLIPSAADGGINYEPWQASWVNHIGWTSSSFGINNPDVIAMCDNWRCGNNVVTGNNGTFRFASWLYNPAGGQPGMGIYVPAGANPDGTFWTDPKGAGIVAPGAAGAVKQYVKPGTNISGVNEPGRPLGANDWECYDVEGWGRPFRCGGDATLPSAPKADRENSVRSPN